LHGFGAAFASLHQLHVRNFVANRNCHFSVLSGQGFASGADIGAPRGAAMSLWLISLYCDLSRVSKVLGPQ
jgi:hypothetical protein